jgi:hypothetical protein
MGERATNRTARGNEKNAENEKNPVRDRTARGHREARDRGPDLHRRLRGAVRRGEPAGAPELVKRSRSAAAMCVAGSPGPGPVGESDRRIRGGRYAPGGGTAGRGRAGAARQTEGRPVAVGNECGGDVGGSDARRPPPACSGATEWAGKTGRTGRGTREAVAPVGYRLRTVRNCSAHLLTPAPPSPHPVPSESHGNPTGPLRGSDQLLSATVRKARNSAAGCSQTDQELSYSDDKLNGGCFLSVRRSTSTHRSAVSTQPTTRGRAPSGPPGSDPRP